MLVTREADYAFRCVLEVARAGRISAAEVARREDISLTFLGKIVQSLARAGILATRRGVGGGMSLAVPPESITLLQVIEAVEGPLLVNSCLTNPPQCDRIATCAAYPFLCKAQAVLREALSATVGELLEHGSVAHAPPAGADPPLELVSTDGKRGAARRGGGR